MPNDVIMPQMGESIVEGTITKWLKQPGERVERDEPLFEISTDKVDAEIPSPTSGVLKEIKVPAGSTVQVNTVVGIIDEAGSAALASTAAASQASPPPPPQTAPASGRENATAAAGRRDSSASAARAGEEETEVPTYLRERSGVEIDAKPKHEEAIAKQDDTVLEFPKGRRTPAFLAPGTPFGSRQPGQPATGARHRSGRANYAGRYPPLCRAASRGSTGTAGCSGRGSSGGAGAASFCPGCFGYFGCFGRSAPGARLPGRCGCARSTSSCPFRRSRAGSCRDRAHEPMRKKIAERMVESKRTSAHVHSVFEVDMTRIVKLRERLKADFERRNGAKLTFMPFFCRAAIQAIRRVPIVNSSVEGANIHYHSHVNLGIAVALDWGLIVPVVKNAEDKSFLGLQRTITDLAERARLKKLVPDEVSGGTFTITNPGNTGQMFGLPIIMQPQVAIMGIGNVRKQPTVVTDESGMDSIAVRSICHLSLGYDHRIVDGAVADQFLAEVVSYLQNWNEDLG